MIASTMMRVIRWLVVALAGVVMMAGSAGAQALCDQSALLPRPFDLGVSGGSVNDFFIVKHEQFCAGGTLGSLVQDAAGQYILSNNHVLARENQSFIGERELQPGREDQNCARALNNTVANLSRFVKLTFRPSKLNTVDAAIALVAPGATTSHIKNIGSIDSVIQTSPLGLEIEKMGRTTCLTTGKVVAVNVSAAVDYNPLAPGTKVGNFQHQQMIVGDQNSSFAGPGDSGSLIVTDATCPQPVGLLFAGSSSATLANSATDVANALGVSWVGTCSQVVHSSATTSNTDAQVVDAAVSSASAVRDAHVTDLMKVPGAVGTGIGLGDAPGTTSILVLVKSDTAEARAAAPSSIDGVAVHIYETGTFFAF